MSLEGDGVQVYTGNKDKLMDALRRNGSKFIQKHFKQTNCITLLNICLTFA